MGSVHQDMKERLYMALMLHTKCSSFFLWPLSDSLVVNDLIPKWKCTQLHKITDVSLSQEFQNTFQINHLNMELYIAETKKKV